GVYDDTEKQFIVYRPAGPAGEQLQRLPLYKAPRVILAFSSAGEALAGAAKGTLMLTTSGTPRAGTKVSLWNGASWDLQPSAAQVTTATTPFTGQVTNIAQGTYVVSGTTFVMVEP